MIDGVLLDKPPLLSLLSRISPIFRAIDFFQVNIFYFAVNFAAVVRGFKHSFFSSFVSFFFFHVFLKILSLHCGKFGSSELILSCKLIAFGCFSLIIIWI